MKSTKRIQTRYFKDTVLDEKIKAYHSLKPWMVLMRFLFNVNLLDQVTRLVANKSQS